jgi:hypothetical protein
VLTIGLVGQFQDFVDDPAHIFGLHNANEADLFREKFTLIHLPFDEPAPCGLCKRADALIAGGLYYLALKKLCPDAPLVGVHITACALYDRILSCKKQFDACRIGIIAPRYMLLEAQLVRDALQVETRLYDLREFSDRVPLVAQAAAEGCDCILSGHIICQIAEEMGLHPMILRPRADSFYNSITVAKRAALLNRSGGEAAAKRGIILEYSKLRAAEAERLVIGDSPAPRYFGPGTGSVLSFPQDRANK